MEAIKNKTEEISKVKRRNPLKGRKLAEDEIRLIEKHVNCLKKKRR